MCVRFEGPYAKRVDVVADAGAAGELADPEIRDVLTQIGNDGVDLVDELAGGDEDEGLAGLLRLLDALQEADCVGTSLT